MPVQWGITGASDRYISKMYVLSFIPVISLVMLIVYLIIPRIPVMNTNLDQFRKQYDIFWIVMFAFFFYMYLLTILWSLNVEFNLIQLLAPAFSLTLIIIGFLIEQSRQNPLIGIQTPWTVGNEKVWEKSHQLGALIFKIISLIPLFAIIFPDQAIWFVLIPVLIIIVYSLIYFYLVFDQSRKKKKSRKTA